MVLSRFPIRRICSTTSRGRPAGAQLQRVDIAVGDHTLHLTTCTLGRRSWRHHQAERLAATVTTGVGHAEGRAGDFNEWLRGRATTLLSERLQSVDLRKHLRRRRTYPGVFPVLHLDHIYYEGRVDVVKVEMPRTRLALLASDHLPLVAELKVEF